MSDDAVRALSDAQTREIARLRAAQVHLQAGLEESEAELAEVRAELSASRERERASAVSERATAARAARLTETGNELADATGPALRTIGGWRLAARVDAWREAARGDAPTGEPFDLTSWIAAGRPMPPTAPAAEPTDGPREWTPADGGRCIGAQHDERGAVCCGGPDRLSCGVGAAPMPDEFCPYLEEAMKEPGFAAAYEKAQRELDDEGEQAPGWRVGRKIGRTVYIGDELIGVMDSPELAGQVVAAVNAALDAAEAGEMVELTPDEWADVKTIMDRWPAVKAELARLRAAAPADDTAACPNESDIRTPADDTAAPGPVSHAAHVLRVLAGELRDGPPVWIEDGSNTSWRTEVADWLEYHARQQTIAAGYVTADDTAAPDRRLAWSLYHERGGVGSIVTDLDTQQWAAGSADTETEARAIARRRLDESPSGGSGPADADMVEHARACVLRSQDVPAYLAGAVLDEVTRLRTAARLVRDGGEPT